MSPKVIITSPSLNTKRNVSGISSVTQFIIQNNCCLEYVHFELGKKDSEKRNIFWLVRMVNTYCRWILLLIKEKACIVHFNFAVDKFGLLRDTPLLLLAKAFKRPLIIHMHGGEYLCNNEFPNWIRNILKLALCGNHPIIVLSDKQALVVKKYYKCKKIFVLPNCVDLSGARSFERKTSSETLKILFLGRISKNKGLEYIYEALRNLKIEGFLFEFHLAGTGPDEVEYLQKFHDTLGENFRYRGVVSGEAKIDVLKTCNVFLLPSFFEGLPMALLESMSYGLVPIATPVGSINNLIKHGENGLLIKIKSSKEIETAIKEIIDNIWYRKALSEKAKEYIFLNFDPERYVETLNKIYLYE